jgi:Asp-tRNA(Asn)/Glu-tRNA(Gln) amidotransferase A subunit family amidase
VPGDGNDYNFKAMSKTTDKCCGPSRRGRTAVLLAVVIAAPHVRAQSGAPAARSVRGGVESPPAFALEEATVTSIHAALRAGAVTCQQVVRGYLERIEAYDDKGPAINAILAVYPRALEVAARLDRERAAGGAMRPLHCIPIILKDNYDTADMPTTGGSVTLAKSIPPDDAFVVKRFRDADAIILAKANLTELALTGVTVSSLGGQTKNPYDLTRTPGGSSGGTGAAIAANFGVLGTGSDTGQSTRSPSSANSLVGLRPTRGLISRDGIMPFSATQDEIGPITRTVEDAARMLEVMAGYDPADPITAFSAGHTPASYVAALDRDALKGARIGLLTDVIGSDPIHAPVNRVVDQAVSRMTALGATVVRVSIPELGSLTRNLSLMALEFQPTLNRYLASLGPNAPVKTFAEFMARGQMHPSLRNVLEGYLRVTNGPDLPEYQKQLNRRGALRQAIMTVIAANNLDALLYPHQRRLVVPIGEDQADRNGVLSNGTGFPALTFPGGFSPPTPNAPIGVPVGLELLGPEWREATLLTLAYAYEQATQARKPPRSTPPLAPLSRQ